MSAYLEQHLPHLTALHTSLGLPTSALEDDRVKIDAAIKAVVVSIVRERETEVENWKEAISAARKDVVCLGRALGNRSAGSVEETDEPLPKQHERLLCQTTELEKAYRDRLAKVEELQEALTALANLLGSPFDPPKPLQPVAGPSGSSSRDSTAATTAHRTSLTNGAGAGSRKASGTSFKPETAEERKRSNIGVGPMDDQKREVWLEVTDQVIEALQLDCKKATEERDNRRRQLITDLVDLRWIHSELALPPLSLGTQPSSFPVELLPDKSKEETPGAHQTYEKLLAKFIATYKEDSEGEVEEKGLDDLQPEIGLLNWVNELSSLWHEHKAACEARIQQLFDQIEPHWQRMAVEQEFMDTFFDINRGSGEEAIVAYEAELERVLELRRQSLSTYMDAVRKEIEDLWTELMMSDEEKDNFVGFIDDEYTEELLQAHEEYVELLRAEIESKAAILPRVREWHALVAEEEELERSASDPNRFKMRGGALLKEEKMRKRVEHLKPKIEAELLRLLPAWEAEARRAFMMQGERVIDIIQDAIEAKEAAKEAKKRARQGLAPTRTVKATPAPASARAPATGTARKRVASAETPLPAHMKRPKVAVGSTLKPMTTNRTIPASSARIPSRHRDGSSPTPAPACGLPRPGPSAAGRAVSSSSLYTSKIPPAQGRIPSAPARSHAALGKDATRRPPRESFRPRPSIAPTMLTASAAPQWDLGEVDEGLEGET